MTTTQTWRDVLSTTDFCAVPDVPSDTTEALQPQYAHAERFKGLTEFVHDELDATPEIESLIECVADPKTAFGIYLDWLGDRVGASRILQTDDGSIRLDDEGFRFLVMLKALQNISAESSAAINSLMTRLLDVPVWVIDHQDMTISVRIFGRMTDEQFAILKVYGIPCRPAGVLTKLYYFPEGTNYFGFEGSGLQPFNQAPFFNGETNL